jgi:hypothetical protein
MAMTVRRNRRFLALSLVPVLAYVQSVPAETLNYGIDLGVGESDNVTLVPTDKVSQTLSVLDLDFDLKEQRRLFDVEAKGDFTDLAFLQGAYNNELVGRFDGLAQYVLLSDHISWAAQDDFGQTQLDPFAAVTPGNRQNVNYASTGPDFAFRLGDLNFISVTARYARSDYAVSPFSSNRFIGTTALDMPLSALSSIAFGVKSERVLFDDTLVNTDFNRSSAYAHYDLQGLSTQLSAYGGLTQVDATSGTHTAPLVKFQLTRKVSAAATWAFTAGRDITDATTDFSNPQSGAGGTLGTAVASTTTANYQVTYANAGWDYVRHRTSFGLSAKWETDQYYGLPALDLRRESADLKVERELTREFTVGLLGRLYRSTYTHQDFAETDGLIGAKLTFRRGRGLEFKLQVDRNSRSVSGSGFGGGGYTENRVFLTVGYRPQPAEPIRAVPGRIGRPGSGPVASSESY